MKKVTTRAAAMMMKNSTSVVLEVLG